MIDEASLRESIPQCGSSKKEVSSSSMTYTGNEDEPTVGIRGIVGPCCEAVLTWTSVINSDRVIKCLVTFPLSEKENISSHTMTCKTLLNSIKPRKWRLCSSVSAVLHICLDLARVNIEQGRRIQVIPGAVKRDDSFVASLVIGRMYEFHLRSGMSINSSRHSKIDEINRRLGFARKIGATQSFPNSHSCDL